MPSGHIHLILWNIVTLTPAVGVGGGAVAWGPGLRFLDSRVSSAIRRSLRIAEDPAPGRPHGLSG